MSMIYFKKKKFYSINILTTFSQDTQEGNVVDGCRKYNNY